MGRIVDSALAITDLEIGMVIFSVGNPGERIDEGHGLVKILEAEFPGNGPLLLI